MRHANWIFMVALVAAAGLSGCNEQQVAQNGTNTSSHASNSLTVPSGTSIEVTLGTALSSETAGAGTAWSGTVLNGREGIPTGSSVAGTVTSAKAARKGDRAMLDLGLTSVTVAGHRYAMHGSTEPIIAGSTRARNLGAIGGSAAAGAIVGHQVGGSDKGTIIGALIGAGVATAVVANSDGYQVVLKPGSALTFTTNEAVAVRQ
jgi:outer membrane lipoprotein SlyB